MVVIQEIMLHHANLPNHATAIAATAATAAAAAVAAAALQGVLGQRGWVEIVATTLW